MNDLRAPLLTLLTLVVGTPGLRAEDTALYELRIYTCESGKLDALHQRFRDHTMRLFEKHGMENIAYWVPTDGPSAENTLIYLLRHKDDAAAKASWAGFRGDPEWKEVAAKSEADHGKILATRPESILLKATDYSPAVSAGVDPGKVYELRTYTAAEGKLDELDARFREHTDRLFKKHGMKSIGYWHPVDAEKSKTTLIYILQHDSAESARASWTGFRGDEQWIEAKAESEKNGPLLAEPPQAVYMKTTNYSPKAKQDSGSTRD